MKGQAKELKLKVNRAITSHFTSDESLRIDKKIKGK